MIIKFCAFGLLFLVILLTNSPQVYAKRKLPSANQPISKSQTTASTNRPIISPRLRNDRLALVINFSNLLQSKSISYTLSYMTKGISQGVVGTINPTSDSAQRELLFGTCSSGTCRYHSNITNMKLIVTSTLKSGGRLIKSYRVKP